MIKLTFYTTEKMVSVDFGNQQHENYNNVPTVQVREGYYEVMQKENDSEPMSKVKPVLRVPISQTIMYIQD